MSLVFVDVDTQLDFLMPAGALYAPGAERTEPVLAKLTQFALARQIQIVATADAHAEDDLEFRTWKPHCVVGTPGQQRCSATATGRSMVLGQEGGTLAPRIVVEKQALDPFTNPHLLDLLRRLRAERYVVYGLVTEHCVAATVFRVVAAERAGGRSGRWHPGVRRRSGTGSDGSLPYGWRADRVERRCFRDVANSA